MLTMLFPIKMALSIFPESFRINAGRMQRDFKTIPVKLFNSFRQLPLQQRLATAEHNPLQKATPRLQPAQHLFPGIFPVFTGRQQMPVMAIPATPRASLTENDCGKPAGKIYRRKRRDSPDLQNNITYRSHKSCPDQE